MSPIRKTGNQVATHWKHLRSCIIKEWQSHTQPVSNNTDIYRVAQKKMWNIPYTLNVKHFLH